MTEYCPHCNLVVERFAPDRVVTRTHVAHQSCVLRHQLGLRPKQPLPRPIKRDFTNVRQVGR